MFGPSLKAQKNSDGILICPSCRDTVFKIGPSGGLSTNIYCNNCPSRWNYTAHTMTMEPINEEAANTAIQFNESTIN